MKKIEIKGLTCEACTKLIASELEDAGLFENIASFELNEDGYELVWLHVKEDTGSDNLIKMVEVINSMDRFSASLV